MPSGFHDTIYNSSSISTDTACAHTFFQLLLILVIVILLILLILVIAILLLPPPILRMLFLPSWPPPPVPLLLCTLRLLQLLMPSIYFPANSNHRNTCTKTVCSYPCLSLGLFVVNQVQGTNWGGGPKLTQSDPQSRTRRADSIPTQRVPSYNRPPIPKGVLAPVL